MLVVSDTITASLLKQPKRQVSIRRDGKDFVVAFQPDDVVVFRHQLARSLRRVCRSGGKLYTTPLPLRTTSLPGESSQVISLASAAIFDFSSRCGREIGSDHIAAVYPGLQS